MGEVDESFIQAVEHRPKLAITEAEGIPLINLSVFNSHDLPSNPSSIETLVEEIRDACKNWGFFQVINHGVPLEKREKLELASRKFFAQSTEEKLKVRRDEVNPQGYYDSEVTKNVRDWKEVFDMTVKNPTVIPASHEAGDNGLKEVVNRWPEYPSELREAFEEYAEEMEKLAHNPSLALGVTRHKDAGALTILAQDDVGGLQVKRKTDGEWIRVKPTPQLILLMLVTSFSNRKFKPDELIDLVVAEDPGKDMIGNGEGKLREKIGKWEACEEYAVEMEKLAHKLLELISLSLGLKANRLSGFFNDHTSFTKLVHYPSCPIPHLALGISQHKDAGALAILAQDNVGGLQVKRKADGEWIHIKPTPHAYIVNVGDTIQGCLQELGGFQVINHGVPLEKREKLEMASRTFFAQSTEEKLKVRGNEANPAGHYDSLFTKNVRGWKEVLDQCNRKFKPDELIDLVVAEDPGKDREACEEYAEEMEKLAHKLLELISLSLGLKANRLSGFFNDHTSFTKLVHHPSCPIPHLALGISQHKDAGALTILAQDNVGGLIVKRKADGEWTHIKPTPHAYIVNVGDTIQVPFLD
ncbi:hypothetical protein C3L33_20886, partial [Rhododendron williamsianum]